MSQSALQVSRLRAALAILKAGSARAVLTVAVPESDLRIPSGGSQFAHIAHSPLLQWRATNCSQRRPHGRQAGGRDRPTCIGGFVSL